MTARKTFSVAEFLWMENYFLKHSDPEQIAERQATINTLNIILHKTGNYKGFNYLQISYNEEGLSVIPDETRVFYFVSSTLMPNYIEVEEQKKSEDFIY